MIETPEELVSKLISASARSYATMEADMADIIRADRVLIRADERQKAAERQRELLEAARAFQALNVCYRVGKTPSEALFRRIEKATAAIMAEPKADV